MGVVAGIVNDVTNAIYGNNGTSTLDDFLNKFNSSEGKFVNQIDPLTTFDVTMKFYPILENQNSSNTVANRIMNVLGTTFTSAINNLGNNITGGLLGSLLNGTKKVQGSHDQWNYSGQKSFVEMLAEANLIVGGENWFSNQSSVPLELNLGPYVQEITIPNMMMSDGGKQLTLNGEFINNGIFIRPDTNNLIMQILNSKAALHERIFYPWMREVTQPYWSYITQPYTTATITVDFSKHMDLKYVFCGCRPSQIFSMQAKQDTSSGENLTRQVMFIFDFMYIHSNLEISESLSSTIASTIGTVFNSAANIINL